MVPCIATEHVTLQLLFIAVLLFSSSHKLSAAAFENNFEDALDQHKVAGGVQAAQSISTTLADRHFDSHGAKWPTKAFAEAVKQASLTIQPSDPAFGSPRMLVLMAMANDVAMQVTVPTFVQSLKNVAVAGGSGISGTHTQTAGSLVDHFVLACSSASAADLCMALGLGSRCVVDDDMALGNKSLPFHSIGFNMIGFAKIKYILNTIAMGRDIIFMDTDITVFRDFVPHVLSMGADIAAMMEKCLVVDDQADYSGRDVKQFPLFNIGITYFRASPGVTRCVYNWLFDMWVEVKERPRVWDQDIFKKVMFHCTKLYGVRIHAFSPRLFNSYCYKPCGCNYTDEDVLTKVDTRAKTLGYASADRTCGTGMFSQWLLMHFPCGGQTHHKAELMQQYLQMYQDTIKPTLVQ